MNTLPDYIENYSYPDPSPLGNDWAPQYSLPQYVLDIDQSQQDQKVSENFWLRDYTRYRNGTKQFRNAIVSRDLVTNIQEVRNRLAKPIYITSGYRAPGYNQQLNGSATYSRHMYGDGVDIASAHASATELKRLCDQENAYFSLAYQDGHAHCDWRHLQLDKAFYPGAVDPNAERLDPYFITGGRIAVRDLKNNFELSLKDFMPFADHEGAPIYNWHIVNAEGQEFQSDKQKLVLKKQSHKYYVQLLVGDSVYFEKTILW